jgi:protein-tyrosine-phosphatase
VCEGESTLRIVTLCTGNVARSVMLGYMLMSLAEDSGEEWAIRTAGTHVTEGSAMSGRTREALTKIEGLGDHRYGAHRSHQFDATDAEWADVVVAAEADNVQYVRRNFASFANKAVQLGLFVRFAPASGSLDEKLRVATAHEPMKDLDVDDPAGGDQETYDRCARQLWGLAQSFARLVEGDSVG